MVDVIQTRGQIPGLLQQWVWDILRHRFAGIGKLPSFNFNKTR